MTKKKLRKSEFHRKFNQCCKFAGPLVRLGLFWSAGPDQTRPDQQFFFDGAPGTDQTSNFFSTERQEQTRPAIFLRRTAGPRWSAGPDQEQTRPSINNGQRNENISYFFNKFLTLKGHDIDKILVTFRLNNYQTTAAQKSDQEICFLLPNFFFASLILNSYTFCS